MMKNVESEIEKFCNEYAQLGDATVAYKSAGFKTKTRESAQASASRLLANPEVQARLHELSEKTAGESIADVKELQEGLTRIFRGQAITSLMTKDGEVVEVPVSAERQTEGGGVAL